MVMTPEKMWIMVNRNRYRCTTCGYNTYNANNYLRHCNSAKHWLLNEFAQQCPTDLKILIGSFLPLKALMYCGRLGLKAMDTQSRDWGVGRMLIIPPSASLHVRIVDGVTRIRRRRQNRVVDRRSW